jgi:ribosomal protein S18 acetylase RimI-like enzyme
MAADFTIRRASLADAEAIRDVFVSARMSAMPWLPVLPNLDEVTHWLTTIVIPFSHVFVADQNGKVLGFAALKDNVLDHLYVSPATQRAGIGTALLEAVKADAGDTLRLYTYARNTLAKRFYEKHGFREVPSPDFKLNEEGQPDILLELDIAKPEQGRA